LIQALKPAITSQLFFKLCMGAGAWLTNFRRRGSWIRALELGITGQLFYQLYQRSWHRDKKLYFFAISSFINGSWI
jgi:hypothetical protein